MLNPRATQLVSFPESVFKQSEADLNESIHALRNRILNPVVIYSDFSLSDWVVSGIAQAKKDILKASETNHYEVKPDTRRFQPLEEARADLVGFDFRYASDLLTLFERDLSLRAKDYEERFHILVTREKLRHPDPELELRGASQGIKSCVLSVSLDAIDQLYLVAISENSSLVEHFGTEDRLKEALLQRLTRHELGHSCGLIRPEPGVLVVDRLGFHCRNEVVCCMRTADEDKAWIKQFEEEINNNSCFCQDCIKALSELKELGWSDAIIRR